MVRTKSEKNLVIVESPAKAKTIEKILGKDYQVIASFGHVRDLPKSKLGVDIEHNFTPSYSTIKGKGEVVKKLRDLAKKSNKIYLASDPDREGEAIAWHLAHALKLEENSKNRIEFNEITESAVQNSIKNARKIDMDKVNAQQARRILDRLVGYEISPLLWKSVLSNTSAGRVQSVALKLICNLEEEIRNFIPVKYWDIKGTFDNELELSLYKIDNKRFEKITDEAVVNEIKGIEKKQFTVTEAKVSKKSKNPPFPLKTSTLQQLASSYLGFSASKTMRVAQGLYEGVDINGNHKGLITYMRTDSTRISEDATKMAQSFIINTYGKEYLGFRKESKSKQKIQDAHEAIRPTDIYLTPEILGSVLNSDQMKLYKLIWERFLISQLAPMKYEQFELIVNYGRFDFRGSVNKILFDGYYKVFKDEESLPIGEFPAINIGELLTLKKLTIKDDFTKPPARFSEASLVKKLEAEGIGRPSTYASIIETLKKREYVTIERKNFIPTELGFEVKNILESNFSTIMDVKFTAKLETELDEVAEGQEDWIKLLSGFYSGLKENIDKYKVRVEEEANRIILSDVPCTCGKGNMILKTGRFGRYLACPNFKTEEDCNEKISLRGIDIPLEEVAEGKIKVKHKIEGALKVKRGMETDVKTEKGVVYLLKTGRFGSYLESEDYKNDNLRIPLPTIIRKKLANDKIHEENGIILLKDELDKIKKEEEKLIKEAGVCEKCGRPFKVGSGRWGKFLACTGYPECKNIRKIVKKK